MIIANELTTHATYGVMVKSYTIIQPIHSHYRFVHIFKYNVRIVKLKSGKSSTIDKLNIYISII